jgi:nicotinamidase-related amidase
MLLDAARSQLLIVDVQDRLVPAMHGGEAMIDRCAIMLQAARQVGVPVTITEQYRKGLGATVQHLETLRGDTPLLEKVHFSAALDPAIAARIGTLVSSGRRQVVIAGIESHVCVMQSALGFKEMGFDVAVVADAVTSRRPESVALALERFRAHGVDVVNTEMTVFEWLKVAGTPAFKAISALIK